MRRLEHVAARRAAAALVVAGLVVGSGFASWQALAVGPGDWPAYLGGPAHTSRTSDAAITPANAPSLEQQWHFVIPYVSSPVVADGSVFLGSFAGWFYKIDALTGIRQKKVFLGFQARRTCPEFGFASTAAVARDPSTGKDTVYVAAPNTRCADGCTAGVSPQAGEASPTEHHGTEDPRRCRRGRRLR